jgi:uncharacterized protein involved in exopolysaccharide biosynthesis
MGSSQNYVAVSRRQPDIEDYIDMLRRYRSWVIGPAFAGFVIAVVVAFCWPDTYESRAVMRISPQSVSPSLVEGVATTSMAQRLDQISVEILGRTSLMSIIQEPTLNLYPKERAHVTLDEVAEKMRTKDIKIDLYDAPGASSSAHGARAFRVSFRYVDRFKAQAVVREITGKFEEYNFSLQRNQAATTANFLTDELKKAKDRVDAAQAQLSQFVSQHGGELPEDAIQNTTLANTMEQEIHGLEDSIGRTQEQKFAAEIQLQNLKLQEANAAASIDQSQTAPNIALRNDRVLAYDKMIADAQERLRALQTLYKDDYPEVKSQKAYIKGLEDQRNQIEKAESGVSAASGSQARVVQNSSAAANLQALRVNQATISGTITNLDSDIARQTKHLNELQGKLRVLQSKVASSPVLVQRYNELESEFNLAKEAYDQKSKTRDLSETAENLEEHHAGETLDLLEPADLPDSPAEPNRWAIIGLGTFVGILTGFGLAGAKELKNTSLKNLKDVRAYTNLPVLTSVPLLENALLVRRKRRLAWLAWSSAIVIGGILMCGAAYYHLSSMAGAG